VRKHCRVSTATRCAAGMQLRASTAASMHSRASSGMSPLGRAARVTASPDSPADHDFWMNMTFIPKLSVHLQLTLRESSMTQ
jgi:hypothetical protein